MQLPHRAARRYTTDPSPQLSTRNRVVSSFSSSFTIFLKFCICCYPAPLSTAPHRRHLTPRISVLGCIALVFLTLTACCLRSHLGHRHPLTLIFGELLGVSSVSPSLERLDLSRLGSGRNLYSNVKVSSTVLLLPSTAGLLRSRASPLATRQRGPDISSRQPRLSSLRVPLLFRCTRGPTSTRQ